MGHLADHTSGLRAHGFADRTHRGPAIGEDQLVSGSLGLEVLVLNGSAGAGKSTLARELSEVLREDEVAHAVLDVDELARVFPDQGSSNIKWANVAAVWPTYATVPELSKVILPVLIDTDEDLRALRAATPCGRFIVRELVAPKEVLLERVTEREPNEYWRRTLRELVEIYWRRDPSQKFADFQVRTDEKPPRETANDIATRLGWRKLEA